ncbi:hypothetical protein GCM10027579_13740 [Calidifontibacter terrae]
MNGHRSTNHNDSSNKGAVQTKFSGLRSVHMDVVQLHAPNRAIAGSEPKPFKFRIRRSSRQSGGPSANPWTRPCVSPLENDRHRAGAEAINWERNRELWVRTVFHLF